MNDQSYRPICVTCEENGIETLATEKRWDDDLCSNCAQNRDEAAYERMLDDFYGGSGPVTVNEQMDSAYRLNREGRY